MAVYNIFSLLFQIFKELVHNSHFNIIQHCDSVLIILLLVTSLEPHDLLYYYHLDMNFCSLKLCKIQEDLQSEARRSF